ncbi:hypothetical protein [Hymenobacter volaticus]|uniref:Uncharacterized protein n=1 Tax=Hymenobacter volaticus TaxID=2932254 RepID=A0ABY4G9W4_9BACT|nr:hypothetical protein [Hymenobacter volaticus]UOQ67546.1 hypothetical protein MUN86_06645 [Hymenobacter volaticus]
MSTLYLPRRHRRALLLPRGLVALGFLLLIGCSALVGQPELRRYSVMQLTMPVVCKRPDRNAGNCLPSAQEIKRMGFWQTVDFTGSSVTDSSTLHLIRYHLRAMQQLKTSTGLAVRFHEKARYGSLVDALDEANQANMRKYFVDIHSSVTTLYVLPMLRSASFVAAEVDTLPVETNPVATTGIRRWLDRINSHLENQAWGTILLAGLSVWLLVALGQWLLQEE